MGMLSTVNCTAVYSPTRWSRACMFLKCKQLLLLWRYLPEHFSCQWQYSCSAWRDLPGETAWTDLPGEIAWRDLPGDLQKEIPFPETIQCSPTIQAPVFWLQRGRCRKSLNLPDWRLVNSLPCSPAPLAPLWAALFASLSHAHQLTTAHTRTFHLQLHQQKHQWLSHSSISIHVTLTKPEQNEMMRHHTLTALASCFLINKMIHTCMQT